MVEAFLGGDKVLMTPFEPDALLAPQLCTVTTAVEIRNLIQRFELGLGSGVQWSHDRISFLKKMDLNAAAVAEECFLNGVFRTSEKQLRKIAQCGLVALFDAGGITSIEVGALADDIASLLKLGEFFLEEDGVNNLARVWAHAFDLPDGYRPVEINFPLICTQALTEW